MSETWSIGDTVVTIRPIARSDLALEQAFVEGLSTHTGYLRLLSARRPTLEEMEHFTHIDPAREFALIATVDSDGRERQIGVARYVKTSTEGTAEFAIVLSDSWQGRGLGRRLLVGLLSAAKRDGLQRMTGATLWENRGMQALARKLGFKIERDPDLATLRNLVLDLTEWSA
jgi:RimJ/RimL family protein N-acetyltransferase